MFSIEVFKGSSASLPNKFAKASQWNKFLTVTDFGGQSMKPRESKPPQVSAMASLDFGE